jgi:hypothetical protein
MTKTRRTQTRLAAICGVARSTVTTWQGRPDWVGDGATESVLKRYAARRLVEARKAQTGPHSDLKKLKLEKQVRLLQAQADRAESEAARAKLQLDRERNELVPMQEHRVSLIGVVELCKKLLEQTILNISAKRKDAALLAELEAARDSAMITVRDTFLIETADELLEEQHENKS